MDFDFLKVWHWIVGIVLGFYFILERAHFGPMRRKQKVHDEEIKKLKTDSSEIKTYMMSFQTSLRNVEKSIDRLLNIRDKK